MRLTLYLSLLATFSLLGCGPSERNTGTEKGLAPKSPVAYEDMEASARTLALIIGGKYGEIASTGSMEPLLDSSVIALYKESDGSDIGVGMIVAYKSELGINVLHKVEAVNSTHFIANGISNSKNDGWIPRESVYMILVGALYTSGR